MSNRGGPPGLQASAGPVRLDPAKGNEPPEAPPESDPGEAHAANVMGAAERMGAVPSAQAGEVAAEKPQEELTLEEFQRQQDEEFMKDYAGLSVNQLITAGYLMHTVKVGDDFEVVIRTLTEKESGEIEQEVSNMLNDKDNMANSHMSAEVRRHVLARAIVSMGGEMFGDGPADKYKRVESLSAPLTMMLHQEYRKLNKASSILLTGSSGNSLERLLIGDGPL